MVASILQIESTFNFFSEPGSSASIVSDYGLGDQGLIPDKGRGFYL
jgi:hypothetical protein